MEEITFTDFWNAYGLKRDKIAAERAWKRLGKRDQRAAFDGIKTYKEDCSKHGRMMMYAQGYLNHRRWEDEPEEPAEKTAPPSSSEIPLPSNSSHRPPAALELSALASLKKKLREKTPQKPYRWEEYLRIIDGISVSYVDEIEGRLHLCVMINGKQERITDYMIDYYDSYQDFIEALARYFNIHYISFDP